MVLLDQLRHNLHEYWYLVSEDARRPRSAHMRTTFTQSITAATNGLAEPEKTASGEDTVAHENATELQDSGAVETVEKEGELSEDEIMKSGVKDVLNRELPHNDHRTYDKFKRSEIKAMVTNYPGGDIMNQTMWRKMVKNSLMGNVAPPPEEEWYLGARLGEYAKPLVMGDDKVGYLPMAPVPFSASEDLLAQIAQSGVQARAARHAAMYAKAATKQAEEFFQLARRRAKQILRPPLMTVLPGADVFPFYSASSPAFLALAPQAIQRHPRYCHICRRPRCHRELRRAGSHSCTRKRRGKADADSVQQLSAAFL